METTLAFRREVCLNTPKGTLLVTINSMLLSHSDIFTLTCPKIYQSHASTWIEIQSRSLIDLVEY
jgi:hypothetical protein